MIPLGEWLPDLEEFKNPGAIEALNVAPSADGFSPVKSLVIGTNALDSACRGAYAGQAKTQVTHNYAGSGTKLYELLDGVWTDRSKAGGTYSIANEDFWEWTKWGEKVIAVGGVNVPPQVLEFGGTEFTDLAGTPPQARHIAVVRDFVIMANLREGGTDYPDRVRWSGLNDETFWQTSAVRLSDYQPLKGRGGWIMQIRGGEYGVVFQENSIWRMDFLANEAVFQFNETLPGVGTPAPNSVVQWGDRIYFLSQTGFEIVEQGVNRIEIGANRVNKWFFDRIDAINLRKVVGALDRENRRIIWIFPSTGGTKNVATAAVIYDIESDRFSRWEQSVEWIYDALGAGYTLDGLDAVSSSIDDLTISLDSRTWMGGAILLSGFNAEHRSGAFSGDPLPAVVDTKEEQIADYKTLVTRVTPHVSNASGITVTPGVRDSMSDSVSWGSASGVARGGQHPMRANGHYHRFRLNMPNGFKKAVGLSINKGRRSGRI